MADVVVYGIPFSSYTWSARVALKEKGVAFEMIDSQPHTQLQNELHPFGKVPAFRHGEFTLFETTAPSCAMWMRRLTDQRCSRRLHRSAP